MRLFCACLLAIFLALPMYPAGAQERQPGTLGHASSNSAPALSSQLPSSSQSLALELKPVEEVANNFLRRAELQHSLVGLEILHIPSGQVLFSFNGRRRFVPASTTKVVTTSCAMDTFGPDYKFETSLVADGAIKYGVLTGSLLIVPSQDPTFKTEDLRQMLAVLKSQGCKSIEGMFETAVVEGGGDHFSSEWLAQDWGQDWMPVSSDLVIDRNVVGGDPGRGYRCQQMGADGELSALTRSLLLSPWAPSWVSFHKASNSVQVFRGPNQVMGGAIVSNPGQYNLAVGKSLLKSLGIKIEGRSSPGKGVDQWRIAEHQSRPLSLIIRLTLKESDNLYAQQLLRTLGTLPPLNRSLEKASLEERGLARLSQWLYSIGISASEAVLYDGCGLSRKDCLSPHALNCVLRHMAGPKGDGPYVDLLIHDGEGMEKTFRFKTGAMDSVRSICGIVRTSASEPLAVTAIINAHNPSVRELRSSLSSLIDHLQALGPLTLPAPLPNPAPSGTVSPVAVPAKQKVKSYGQALAEIRSRRAGARPAGVRSKAHTKAHKHRVHR